MSPSFERSFPSVKPKLLVVDDEPDNLDLLYRSFYRQFQVLRAESGAAALALLAQHDDVAVIISDQRMPGMSGTELLSRAAVDHPNMVRIILTGYTDVQDLVGAINEGQVFKYVTKPWDDGELRGIVSQAVKAHKLLVARTADLNRVLRQQTLINTITTAIRSTLNPQETFSAITLQLGQALQVDGCALSLWRRQDAYVRCVGLYEAQVDPQAVAKRIAQGIHQLPQSQVPVANNPLLLQLLETREPVAVAQLTPDLYFSADISGAPQAQALLIVPLLVDGQLIGSISLRQQQSRIWRPEEVELAQAVASQAAIAVQQVHLFQTTRQQAEQLLALDRQKTEFFQNISHEFRTPLTLTLGPLEEAVERQRGLDLPETEMALRNSRRLLRLVNQLLDIQRLDAGRMQPSFRPCDMASFVQEVVEAFQPYCDRKSLQLQVQLQPVTVYLDAERFDKVLYNLLSNAVKFTPAGGAITVQLSQEASHCRLEITDTGIGIRTDQMPRLFQRFRQADGSSNRSYEGSGLGLPLARAIAELHGGQIQVESVYGEGSRFILTLPLGSQHLPVHQVVEHAEADEAAPDTQRAAVELAAIQVPEHDVITADLSAAAAQVLVVDDNADLRTYVTGVLQRQGYGVVTAANGAQAYELALAVRPDLIITDWMMPQATGVELIQRVRTHDQLHPVPVILLTAKVDDETRIEGIEQGADAYLSKPFNHRELLAEVRNLLALKANERRVEELNRYLTESVLRRFLPQPLVHKAAQGNLQLDLRPEPRLVTIIFTDMVGFTQLSNQLGPQRVAELLNQYLDAMTSAIFEHGGTVDKFMGDGLMALFGAPEDLDAATQARRAIASIQSMHRKLAQFNRQWHSQGIPPVQFRCGIHQGTAVVGMFGSAERTDFTAIGPSVNMAARLQEAAAPDTILASDAIAQHLDPALILQPQTLVLKGIEAPVQTFSIAIELSAARLEG